MCGVWRLPTLVEWLRPDIILTLGVFAVSIALLTNTIRSWIKDRQFKKKWMINNE